MNDYKLLLGQNIVTRRNNRGVLQRELAHKAGLSRTQLSHIETGKFFPHMNTLYALAMALGVQPHDLLPRIEEAA